MKTDLAHGAEEGLHSPACKSPCGGRLQENCTERDGRAICDVECYNGLHSSEEEVEYLVLTSANTARLVSAFTTRYSNQTYRGSDVAVNRTERVKQTGASAYGLVSRLLRAAGYARTDARYRVREGSRDANEGMRFPAAICRSRMSQSSSCTLCVQQGFGLTADEFGIVVEQDSGGEERKEGDK